MNNDYTDITIVLDRSGSMASIRKETIAGLVAFVDAQRELPGKCKLTLVQFDDHVETAFTDRDLREIEAGDLVLEPRGMTAMLDGIGQAIVATGNRLAAMDEADRPGRVIVVIVTDGQENASSDYSHVEIGKLVRQQQDVYSWQFIFLGANLDAVAVATSVGVRAGNALTYAANKRGTSASYASLGNAVSMLRTCSAAEFIMPTAMAFTDADRAAQADAGVPDPKSREGIANAVPFTSPLVTNR